MNRHRQTLLLLGDIISFAAAFCLMALIRFDVGAQGSYIWVELGLFSLLFIFWLIVLFVFDLYNLRRVNPNPLNIGLLILAMATNFIVGIAFFYLIPQTRIAPKTNLAILVVCASALLIVWRRIFYHLFTKTFTRKIVLIGTNKLLTHLAEEFTTHKQFGTIIGVFDAIPHTITSKIDLIISDGVAAYEILQFARKHKAQLLTLTESYETIFGKIPTELITQEKALTLMNSRANPAINFFSRAAEILIASTILITTSPFVLIALIARYLEDGAPLFYTQDRVGKDGKVFKLYKIRSMNRDAEKDGVRWADESDTRITRIGRILRASHIDEVPQMINIIKGDIGLIGPRPERPEFVASLEHDIPYYFLRHTIRPGFTGWAQIKFRYARTIVDSKEKFEYDLYYIKHRSPILDIGIFLKTIQIIITHR